MKIDRDDMLPVPTLPALRSAEVRSTRCPLYQNFVDDLRRAGKLVAHRARTGVTHAQQVTSSQIQAPQIHAS